MRQIQNISNEAAQKHRIIMAEGPEFDLTLFYKPLQYGWFLTIEYDDIILKNMRVTTGGNILHQWRNLLPFGIACIVDDDQEPTLANDFTYGRAKLYVLSRSEVSDYTEVVSGQAAT